MTEIMSKKKLYSVIQSGKYKGFRVYNELELTPVMALYSELDFYFEKCINEGYHIYILLNKPTHHIIFNNNDINYINMEPYSHCKEDIDYHFSSNIKFIKENQYLDFK
jgi:hypothetical protein